MKKILLILVLVGRVFAGAATVSWDANTESDLAGYKIYYGQNSGSYDDVVDVGNDISWVVDNLIVSATYFFVATAYDSSGNESAFSNEVSTTIIDNRLPSRWNIVFWNYGIPFEEIVLEIVPHRDEMASGNGWTVWGHGQDTDSGLFILNPEKLLVRVLFDAQLIGRGECLDNPKMIAVALENFFIGTTWTVVEFTLSAEKIFINYFDDCWIPETESDANLRVENIRIFK